VRTDVVTTFAELARIAERHGLPPQARLPEPWIGATSHVYPWGETVIKVPFDRPDAIEALSVGAAIGEFARDLGIPAPTLVMLDESKDLLPVTYAIYRRVQDAVPLQAWSKDALPEAWRATGQHLAVLHQVSDKARVPMTLREFRQTPEVDPRPWADELASAGVLAPADVKWLARLLDRLAPVALEEPVVLCHDDLNAANILVHRETGAFLALIDWAGAGWLDPAWDFAAVPLDVVPELLAGHRSVAPVADDDTAEARICWCQVQTRLYVARQAALHPGAFDRDLRQIREFARLARL
jgi:aminoglycoside phosphotransferase (APT) family kinase protein